MSRTPLEADPEVTADRTPVACPLCGHDGSFDGQGAHTKTMTRIESGGAKTKYSTLWHQMRCGECNGHFRILSTATELNGDCDD